MSEAFSYRVSAEKRRILEDADAMRTLFHRVRSQKEVANLLGAGEDTVAKARVAHGIPLYPRWLPEPAVVGQATLVEVVRTAAWRAYLADGRCPVDCPLMEECPADGRETISDCPLAFYYQRTPDKGREEHVFYET